MAKVRFVAARQLPLQLERPQGMEAKPDLVGRESLLSEASGLLLTSDIPVFRLLGSLGSGLLTQKVSKACEL